MALMCLNVRSVALLLLRLSLVPVHLFRFRLYLHTYRLHINCLLSVFYLFSVTTGIMSTMFADTILIVFISVCTALLAEGKLNLT